VLVPMNWFKTHLLTSLKPRGVHGIECNIGSPKPEILLKSPTWIAIPMAINIALGEDLHVLSG
jgi:hypothetical protein